MLLSEALGKIYLEKAKMDEFLKLTTIRLEDVISNFAQQTPKDFLVRVIFNPPFCFFLSPQIEDGG